MQPNSQRECTTLGCQLGPPVAKTDWQKMTTLQRCCLCDGSHVGWLSPTCSLWLPPHTDVHRSMHAHPAACCALLLPARALQLAYAMLRTCICSFCYASRHSPAPWGPLVPGGPPAPHETLAIWRTYCNIYVATTIYATFR
jgi:hypothetical protein